MNEFSITGLKCQSCVEKVSNALVGAGYNNVSVSRVPPQLALDAKNPVSKDELNKVLKGLGDYRVDDLSASRSQSPDTQSSKAGQESLRPLFVILSFIVAGVIVSAAYTHDFSMSSLMSNFMGGFLVVFSVFKFLNLSGFADAYATYDIIAARSRAYALLYPFIELALGIAYFLGVYPVVVNSVAAALMSVGSIGVYKALKSKRKFQCACLGTALKLPMTKITLLEDVLMAGMAIFMLIH